MVLGLSSGFMAARGSLDGHWWSVRSAVKADMMPCVAKKGAHEVTLRHKWWRLWVCAEAALVGSRWVGCSGGGEVNGGLG